ncbi:MAG: hypothetical protein V9G20_32630 [Candidatus Promineifilaceae bacterium]
MNASKQKRLEAQGWKVGSVAEFLELTPEEQTMLALAEKLPDEMAEKYLEERAKRGSRAKYETVLAKVPDVENE